MVGRDARTAQFARVETERLLLRRPVMDDMQAFFAIHSDPATNRYNPAGPLRSPDRARQLIARDIELWDRHGFNYWAVSAKVEPAVIGFGGIGLMSWREREILNVYYRFSPSVWGNGYASEVVRTAIDFRHGWLPDFPLVVRTRPANAAARRVAEKSGLERRPDLDCEFVVYALGW
ncbi:MAG: GNAT family N-acetyltransferase [Candidatus Dormibacteraeota bacterium]|nr:GNAT family N-acetyltransferase [Candidatus Dormibacteraeota bacterium]